MKSHEFKLSRPDWAGIILPTTLVIAVLAACLKLGGALGVWPAPPISFYPDLTVLRHQALAARARDPARVVLLGDSTCLMGVDARALSQRLPEQTPALNLAMVIGLGLDVYGEELSDFTAANPGQVRVVVLLVSPAKLASQTRTGGGTTFRAQMDHPEKMAQPEQDAFNRDWIGARLLRQNIFGRLLDNPLRGEGKEVFGFSSGIDLFLTEHRGSLMDSGAFVPSHLVHPDQYILSPQFEAESRLFRDRVPAGAKLLIGLTPRPRSLSQAADGLRRDDVLRQWNQWLNADGVLTNLPFVLPDSCFSKTAHLNEIGQRRFTTRLAKELSECLKTQTEAK